MNIIFLALLFCTLDVEVLKQSTSRITYHPSNYSHLLYGTSFMRRATSRRGEGRAPSQSSLRAFHGDAARETHSSLLVTSQLT